MDYRSAENQKEKMKRSDSCSRECRFRSDQKKTSACIFETCLLEELPPLQRTKIAAKCCICGNSYETDAISAVSEDRICPECAGKLDRLAQHCDEILTHIKHPI